jgi:hypothetical protein
VFDSPLANKSVIVRTGNSQSINWAPLFFLFMQPDVTTSFCE